MNRRGMLGRMLGALAAPVAVPLAALLAKADAALIPDVKNGYAYRVTNLGPASSAADQVSFGYMDPVLRPSDSAWHEGENEPAAYWLSHDPETGAARYEPAGYALGDRFTFTLEASPLRSGHDIEAMPDHLAKVLRPVLDRIARGDPT